MPVRGDVTTISVSNLVKANLDRYRTGDGENRSWDEMFEQLLELLDSMKGGKENEGSDLC